MTEDPSTVLMVAYHYPPSASVGARRTASFAEHLPQFGWRPIVLTASEDSYPVHDGTALNSSRHAVIRTPRMPLYLRARHRPLVRIENGVDSKAKRGRGGWRAAARSLARTCLIPDRTAAWIPAAVARGALASLSSVETVYATSPPPSALFVGAALAALLRVPLVVDLRDNWALYPDWLYFDTREHVSERLDRIRLRVDARLERAVLGWADAVILNTEPMRTLYARTYPELSGRMFVVTNGYEPSEFPTVVESIPATDPVTLLFAGSYYGAHLPDAFLQGLDTYLTRDDSTRPAVRVDFVGQFETREPNLARRLEREGVVRISGWVPRRTALDAIRGADALLLTLPRLPSTEWWVPAKLYEYLASGNPIFAVAPAGPAADLVRASPLGVWIEPTSPSDIADALGTFLRRILAAPQSIERDVTRFARPELARELATILDRVVAKAV